MKILYGNSSVHTKVCDDIIEDTVKVASQHNHWTENQQKYCSAKFREVYQRIIDDQVCTIEQERELSDTVEAVQEHGHSTDAMNSDDYHREILIPKINDALVQTMYKRKTHPYKCAQQFGTQCYHKHRQIRKNTAIVDEMIPLPLERDAASIDKQFSRNLHMDNVLSCKSTVSDVTSMLDSAAHSEDCMSLHSNISKATDISDSLNDCQPQIAYIPCELSSTRPTGCIPATRVQKSESL